MTLLQMKYFQAVCTYDGVSNAAEQLHVSQPTVSTAIHMLEDEFRIALFDKAGKKLRLTEAGAVFLSLCDGILAQAEDARRTMLDMAGEKKPVRLGIDPALAAIILPSLYRCVSQEFPGSQLYVEENEAPQLSKRLNRRELDMVLVPDMTDSPRDCSRIEVGRWECALCVSDKHRLAARHKVSAHDLGDLELIAFPGELPPMGLPHAFYAAVGQEPRIVYRSGQLSTIRRMIVSNQMGHFTYRVLAETWRGTHVCLLNPPHMQAVSLYWPKDAYLTACARNVIHCLKQLRDTDGFRIDL